MKNIFLDTCVFVQLQLNFKHPLFLKLIKYVERKDLNLVLTDVVKKEVERKIAEKCDSILIAKNKLEKEAKFVIPSAILKELNQIDKSTLQSTAISNWEEFLSNSNAEIVDSTGVSINDVLDMYFDCKPPFNEGKKRKEFPDAISMISLKKHLLSNNSNIDVVSTDSDLKSYCKEFEFLSFNESLSEALKPLDKYSEEQERAITNILEFLSSETLNNSLTENFDDIWFTVKQCPDIEVAEVGNLTYACSNFSILDLSLKKKQAVLLLDLVIDFEAHLKGYITIEHLDHYIDDYVNYQKSYSAICILHLGTGTIGYSDVNSIQFEDDDNFELEYDTSR